MIDGSAFAISAGKTSVQSQSRTGTRSTAGATQAAGTGISRPRRPGPGSDVLGIVDPAYREAPDRRA